MEIKERGFGSLNIGDQERGYHIGTYQSKVFCNVRGVELKQYLDEMARYDSYTKSESLEKAQWVCDYVYSALVAYAKIKKHSIDFDADDVTFWVDTTPLTETAKVFATLIQMQRDMPKKSDA